MITSVPAHFAEQHTFSHLDAGWAQVPVIVCQSGPDGEHLAFHRLLLGRVGNDGASGRLLLDLHPLDRRPRSVRGRK